MQRPRYSSVEFLHAEPKHNGAPRIAAWSRQGLWAAAPAESEIRRTAHPPSSPEGAISALPGRGGWPSTGDECRFVIPRVVSCHSRKGGNRPCNARELRDAGIP